MRLATRGNSKINKMITGMQIRMARSALKWKVSDLADKTGIPWARVQFIERTDSVPKISEEMLEQIKSVLEENGISFISNENDDNCGVLYKKG